MPSSEPLIVTAAFDAATQAYLDALRAQHYPPGRTVVGAHLTLFHAIPAQQSETLAAFFASAKARHPAFVAILTAPRHLGRGVAIAVDAPALIAMHRQLAMLLQPHLTKQDAQPFWPHVTLANKMLPADAKQLFQMFASTWQPRTARIEGFTTWRYCNPHWQRDSHVQLSQAL